MHHQHIEGEELALLNDCFVELDDVFADDLGVGFFVQIGGAGLDGPGFYHPATVYLKTPSLVLVELGLQDIDLAVIDHPHGVDAQVQVLALDIFVLERDLKVFHRSPNIQNVGLAQDLIGQFGVGFAEIG